MIDLNTVNEIYLYTGTTDFRYGIYGLSRLVLSQFDKDTIKSFYNRYIKKGLKVSIIEEDGYKKFKMELIGK